MRLLEQRLIWSATSTCITGGAFGLFSVLVACQGVAPGDASDHMCGRSDALVSGVSRAELLGMTEAEENAVVDLTFGLAEGEEHCTGTLVAEGWVLTAKHCARGMEAPSVTVRLGPHTEDAPLTTSSTETWAHPSLDLMLVRVDLGSAPPVSSLPVAANSVPEWGDDRVQLAGYGVDGAEGRGHRAFVVERIAEIRETALVVDGLGRSGGCIGDSGGPILGRDARGAVTVLGVLSEGSVTCRDRDVYVRGDAGLEWLAERLPAGPSPPPPSCGAIDSKGRCFGARAIWCAGSTLSVDTCAPGECGWDASRGGFGCVRRAKDPCRGVPGDGVCVDGVATFCTDGAVHEFDCTLCGPGCVLSPASGRAACLR